MPPKKPKPAPGSVYRTPTGRWVGQQPPAGGRKSETFDTEAEAWDYLKRVYARRILLGGDPDRAGALTLGAALEQWLNGLVIKESTRGGYRQQLRPIFAHELAATPLRDVRPELIETLIKVAAPGNPRVKVADRLRPFFRKMVVGDYIARDYYLFSQGDTLKGEAKKAAKKKRLTSTGKAWTLNEARTAFAGIERPYFRAMLAFMLVTGARRGETLGLAWGAVDGCTATLGRNRTMGGGEIVEEDTPKNGEERTAYFGSRLSAMLEGLRPANAKANDYVFVSPRTGGPLSPGGVTVDIKRQMTRMGLTQVGATHAMRRTFATLMDADGCPALVREYLLGHAGSRYAIPQEEDRRKWAERADELFLGGLD